jgi:spermidine synthase
MKDTIYNEMMTHPALFTHPQPKKVAVVGEFNGIVDEIAKHTNITDIGRVSPLDLPKWLKETPANSFDIIIQTADFGAAISQFHPLLKADGIFVQPCTNSLLQPNLLKSIYDGIKQGGFNDWQTLHFPHPGHSSHWYTIALAIKRTVSMRIREKDIYNRTFKTRYYNYDIHKAALALPQFVHDELELEMES